MTAERENNVMVVEISSERRLLPDLAEAWRYRGLALMLMRRNIKLRYAQTMLGAIWVIMQPLLLTGTLTLVLGKMLVLPSDGTPYAIFAFTGTVVWSAFQRIVNETSVSMASSGSLILKVYFPRVLVPVSSALTVIVDLIPSYFVLVVVVALYGLLPGWQILLSPVILFGLVILALAGGLWITMIDAVYRDVRMLIPTALQLFFYISPIVYAQSVVPSKWEMLYSINPLVGFLQAFRWSMIADFPPPPLWQIGWSIIVSLLLLGGGLMVFARLERYAVDRI